MTDDIEVTEQPAYGDMYLRFTDEAEATEALADYPGSVDVIGVIYKTTGEDEPPVALDGWHVNTRGPMSEALLAYAVHPANPVRVWA